MPITKGNRTYVDQHRSPLEEGDLISVRFCVCPYGQTRTVQGTLKGIDQYGGISLTLAEGQRFTTYTRSGSKNYKPGDLFYIAFTWELGDEMFRGFGEHADIEHGHTRAVVRLG